MPIEESKTVTYLIKGSEKRFIEELLYDGKVCLNTFAFFADCETNNMAIDDKIEGLWMKSGYIQFPPATDYIKVENVRHAGHLFCATGYSDSVFHKERPYRYTFPEDMRNHFEELLLIWNPMVFYTRLIAAAEKKGLTYRCGWVKYDIKSEEQFKTGELYEPFHKRKDLTWEQEYRFVFYGYPEQKMEFLYLGSLEDIACVFEKNKRYDLVNLSDDKYEVLCSDLVVSK